MVSERYARAYKEVIEVLKHTKRDDVNKIPKDQIVLWKLNMKKDYDFKIQKNKTLEEQGLSNEAKAIISNIYKNYWATDSERAEIEAEEIKEKEYNEQAKFGLEELEKVFKLNKVKSADEDCTSVTIVEEKETFLSKILNSIKRIFKLEK